MRSDWASKPTRGSRFVGLLSMIITSVLGSGRLRAQDKEKSRAAASAMSLRIGDLAENCRT